MPKNIEHVTILKTEAEELMKKIALLEAEDKKITLAVIRGMVLALENKQEASL